MSVFLWKFMLLFQKCTKYEEHTAVTGSGMVEGLGHMEQVAMKAERQAGAA